MQPAVFSEIIPGLYLLRHKMGLQLVEPVELLPENLGYQDALEAAQSQKQPSLRGDQNMLFAGSAAAPPQSISGEHGLAVPCAALPVVSQIRASGAHEHCKGAKGLPACPDSPGG